MKNKKNHKSIREKKEYQEGSEKTTRIRQWYDKCFRNKILLFYSYPAVRENFPLIAFVLAYILIVYGVHAFFGIQDKIILKYYYGWFAIFSILFSAIFLILHIPNKSYKRYLTPNYLAGFLIIIFLLPLFKSAFASYKQTIPLLHDFHWDIALMRLDYVLHFGHHPWRLLEPILSHEKILRAIDILYMMWFLFLFLFCLWMAWTRRRRLRTHFFMSTMLVWSLLGSGLGTIFSSAGPCYYSKVTSTSENPFASLFSRLSEMHHHSFLWAMKNQFAIWQAKEDNIWLPFGGISAMPSIHLAMATIFVMLAFNVHKSLGIVSIGYLVLMQVGSVILGWHYAVDGYIGIILAFLIWKIIGRVLNQETV